MCPDFAKTGLIEIADDFITFRYRADRVVHNECRPDVVSLENRLHLPQRPYRSDAASLPRARQKPVKFGFSVHHSHYHWLLGYRPSDGFANTSFHHRKSWICSAYELDLLRFSRLQPDFLRNSPCP